MSRLILALFETALYRSSARGNLNGRPFRGAVCSDPKVTYSDTKVTQSDPTHLPLPPPTSHLAKIRPLVKCIETSGWVVVVGGGNQL